ncbi:cytochrome bd-I oxidase subunit CydX [Vibrio cholerae]|nr:cytochrome bd-I oxidase subunit CydX [Vibrio cholerae]
MWYFIWISGLFLAATFSILNIINLEKIARKDNLKLKQRLPT